MQASLRWCGYRWENHIAIYGDQFLLANVAVKCGYSQSFCRWHVVCEQWSQLKHTKKKKMLVRLIVQWPQLPASSLSETFIHCPNFQHEWLRLRFCKCFLSPVCPKHLNFTQHFKVEFKMFDPSLMENLYVGLLFGQYHRQLTLPEICSNSWKGLN